MSLQNTMKALSDPIRREILNLLKGGRLSAGAITEQFSVTGAAISRHLSVLKEADLILAEDTRTSGILLKHYEIKNTLQSHHKFNEHKTIEPLVQRMLAGEVVALVSDAGTPAISDPGFLLVRECVRHGVEVQCLPGATAFVPALVSSGLPNDRFCFEGFLPQKKGRQTRLLALQAEHRTMIFYESPYRLVKTLTQFAEYFGAEREVAVCREISKLHEETVRGTLTEVIAHFTATEPRGEIVIILGGSGLSQPLSKRGDSEEDGKENSSRKRKKND